MAGHERAEHVYSMERMSSQQLLDNHGTNPREKSREKSDFHHHSSRSGYERGERECDYDSSKKVLGSKLKSVLVVMAVSLAVVLLIKACR